MGLDLECGVLLMFQLVFPKLGSVGRGQGIRAGGQVIQ